MGIIAMTATVVGIDNGNEMMYLKQLGFKMNDSKIKANFDPKKDLPSISEDEFASHANCAEHCDAMLGLIQWHFDDLVFSLPCLALSKPRMK